MNYTRIEAWVGTVGCMILSHVDLHEGNRIMALVWLIGSVAFFYAYRKSIK